MRIPGIPMSKPGVLMRAQREMWPFRPNKGHGGGKEFPLILVLPETPVSEMTEGLRSALVERLEALKAQQVEAQVLMDRLKTVLN